MADLSTLFLTFNCGRELVNIDFFAACVNQGLSKAQLPPDVIVLSLQEIAPLGYSFLGGSFLSPYFERFSKTIQKLNQIWSNDEQYETILCSNVGMTALMLFARPEVARKIGRVQTAGTGVGVWEMGNKGAVGARLAYSSDDGSEMDLTFVAAHLAPGEDAWQRRNLDWRTINENLVFTGVTGAEKTRTRATNNEDMQDEVEPLLSSATDDQDTSSEQDNALITSSSYIFFGGDLNYRASDIKPHPDHHRSFPRRSDSPEDSTHYSHMMPNDQLTREKAAGKTLHHLSEARINFAPTYKFSKKSQEQAGEVAKSVEKQSRSGANAVAVPEETEWHWAEHRHPSWCDRILYLALPGREPGIRTYNSLPLQPSSDHKPVILYASIPTQSSKPLDHGISAPYKIKAGWKDRRDAARRREVAVGIVSYVALTWEGRGLLLGAILAILGGWAALRSLLI
ncbi:DNase I-like protein [Aureobasidium subglaciale]|nr:DNase I-like protein [Aureobasidium subglaciale]